ncbi:MAG: hemerythrin family protein [Magnetococcales bacterium]|nr:hemerythrin family protein [Magnetococcales bacterium]
MNAQNHSASGGEYRFLPQDFQVGDPDVDFQHEMLFFLMDGILNYIRSEGEAGSIDMVFGIFEDYIRDHFKCEEDRMERAHYPELEVHRGEHQAFQNRVLELERAYAGAEDEQRKVAVAVQVLEFLKGWLSGHIAVMDRKMIGFLNQ